MSPQFFVFIVKYFYTLHVLDRAKNEERRQKEEKRKMKEEEQRRQKEVEKKAKEEEKQKKMEEIRLKEEQEKKNKEKIAASFKNFFVPKNKTNIPKALAEKSNNPGNSLFMPFEVSNSKFLSPLLFLNSELDKFSEFSQVKENMKLAAITRTILTPERREYLDSFLREDKGNDDCDLYLSHLKSKNYKRGYSENTCPLYLQDDDDLKDGM